jgi:DNA-directed RNA polymerase subunit RPC12/RpoP
LGISHGRTYSFSTLPWNHACRKLFKTLTYDERDNPTNRRILKQVKRAVQKNKCANCGEELPKKNAVLDRFEAMKGYTEENTRLICPECNVNIQEERGYK